MRELTPQQKAEIAAMKERDRLAIENYKQKSAAQNANYQQNKQQFVDRGYTANNKVTIKPTMLPRMPEAMSKARADKSKMGQNLEMELQKRRNAEKKLANYGLAKILLKRNESR